MKRFELYRAEREKGLTYRQIAAKYGVSHQVIGQACGKTNPLRFRYWGEKACVYPNVRAWLNDNKVSKSELIRRMGLETCPNTMAAIGANLNGRTFPQKHKIDMLLAVTGLSYEEFFEREAE